MASTMTLDSNNNNMNSKMNKKYNNLPDNLRLNGKTPSGKIRSFVCSICTRAFARQEHLTRHERSHTKEKPYSCGLCQRKFSRRDLLLRHAHKIHNGNYGDSVVITSSGTVLLSEESTNCDNNKANGASNNGKSKSLKNKLTKKVLKKTLTKKRRFEIKKNFPLKRRASFSAQSAQKYAFPLDNEETVHRIDNVKFSTPEVLPIDYFDANAISQDTNNKFKNDASTDLMDVEKSTTSNTNSYLFSKDFSNDNKDIPILDINLNSQNTFSKKSELNLLDTIDWINGTCNNSATNSSYYSSNDEAGVSPRLKLNVLTSELGTNSALTDNILQAKASNNDNYYITKTNDISNTNRGNNLKCNTMNSNSRRSTPTLFKHNESFLRKQGYIKEVAAMKNDSFNNSQQSLSQLQLCKTVTPTSSLSDNIEDKSENGSLPSNITNQLSTIDLNDNNSDLNNISNFNENVQAIFGNYIKNEELKMNNIDYQVRCKPTLGNNGVTFQIGTENEDISDNYNQSLNPNVMHGSNLTASNGNYTFYGLDYLTISNISRATPPQIENSNKEEFITAKDINLFTPELHQICSSILEFYKCNYQNNKNFNLSPNLVAKELILPSCSELNNYLSYFMNYFATHHSFIHPDLIKLDLPQLKQYIHESSLYNYRDNQDKEDIFLKHANIVCLPIFMATCGSFFRPGCNPKTIELYEISRRILHVYLDRKKKSQVSNEKRTKAHHTPPTDNDSKPYNLWLIQSLILSVIFALFADQNLKQDGNVIKRQITAVCSIVKKNIIPKIQITCDVDGSNNINSQTGTFRNQFDYIMYESSIRCTLMVYNFCNFLKTFYHIDSALFLRESDIENISIPDSENRWFSSSLLSTPSIFELNDDIHIAIGGSESKDIFTKQFSTQFLKFYQSFAFNNLGLHPVPDVLIQSMLYYEFNSYSSFHLFLHKIDTRKLEKNFEQHQKSFLKKMDNNTLDTKLCMQYNTSSILKSDGLILRNSLMVISLFNKIDKSFCSKIWKGEINDIYDKFLNSKSYNLLTNGSYNMLTDFLVALNFSIKNIKKLFSLKENATIIDINYSKISLFSLQCFYYNFLIIIKFLMDFEHSPNFKLLCIYTELKKLADKLLIPKFFSFFPSYFQSCQDVISTYTLLEGNIIPDSNHHYLNIDSDKIEKLINNVIVYAFNDSSFLVMSEQSTNEFLFNNSQPIYYPYISSPQTNALSSQFQGDTKCRLSSPEPKPTKSAIDLLQSRQAESRSAKVSQKNSKQDFYERYQLSLKYVIVAKCFFEYISSNNIHCHFFGRLTTDIKNIEECLKSYHSK